MIENLGLLPVPSGLDRRSTAGADVAGRSPATPRAWQLSLLEGEAPEGMGDPERATRVWMARFQREAPSSDALRIALALAWARACEDGDLAGMCRAASALGLALLDQGSARAAASSFATAEGLAHAAGERAWLLVCEARSRERFAPPGQALPLCARALRLVRRPGCARLRPAIRLAAARLYRLLGDIPRARRCCDRARGFASEIGRGELAMALRREEGEILLERGRPVAAEIAFREAWSLLEGLAPDLPGGAGTEAAAILRCWAVALRACERTEEARGKVAEATARLQAGDGAERGRLGVLAAGLHLEEGEEEAAWSALARAEADLRASRSTRELAELLILRGEARLLRASAAGERAQAREDLLEARLLLRRLGDARGLRRCDLLLDSLRASSLPVPAGAGGGLPRPPRVPRARRLTQLGFLTADPRILRSLEPLESLARTSIPVLILGESGTGKEVLARALHRAAGGRGPFVAVNCGALPTELQESELFGHVRGAFTGAVADKVGLFEAADGGTLLLDEVGEMSPRAQVKLLRVLELGEVRRVGETRTRRVRVRVLAATNADLAAGLQGGCFRRDLYYRVCGLKVELPPLRERLGDVPLLAAHFARLFIPEEEPAPTIAPAALDRLLQHSWPGNVRELRFVMEKAVSLTRELAREQVEVDCIDVEIPFESAPPVPPPEPTEASTPSRGLTATIENTERRLILKALEENGWNRTRAARSLGGMSRTTLIGKMKRLGLFPGPGVSLAGESEEGGAASSA